MGSANIKSNVDETASRKSRLTFRRDLLSLVAAHIDLMHPDGICALERLEKWAMSPVDGADAQGDDAAAKSGRVTGFGHDENGMYAITVS